MADRTISFDVLAIEKAEAVDRVANKVERLGDAIDSASGEIRIDIDESGLDRAIAGLDTLDTKVAKINQQRIRLQGDSSDIERKLAILDAELKRTVDPKRKVEIQADMARLLADLGVAKAALRELESKDVKPRVGLDMGSAFSQAARLSAQLRALATPVTITIGIAGAASAAAWIASISAGLTSIGGLAVASGGIAKAAFSGIGDAVKAMGEKATGGGAAVRASASEIRSATQAITDARRDLERATENVGLAEIDLTRAQEDATRAQAALNDARKEAVRTLQDYQTRSQNMAIDQRDATNAISQAEERLAEVRSDSKADANDIEAAEIGLERARQRQKDLTIDSIRLAEDKASADRKGVDGSDAVTEAQDRFVSASQRVADAERAVREANMARIKATEQLAEAQLRLQEAMQPKGGGGGGVDKLAEAMAKLTPEGQRFAVFIKGLVDGPLKDLQSTAQAKFLPGLQAGIQGFMDNLGGAKQSIGTIATNLGGFFEKIGPSVGRATAALLNLAAVGSGPGLSSLSDTVIRLANKFTEWANSRSAQDVAADIQEIGRTAIQVKDFVVGAVNVMVAIGRTLNAAWNAVSAEWRRTTEGVKADWNSLVSAWNTVSNAVMAGWNGLVSFVRGVPGAISAALSSVWNPLRTAWTSTWSGIQAGWNAAVAFVRGIPGAISGSLRGMWNPMWDAFRGVINRVIAGWNRLSFRIGGFKIPSITGPGGITIFPGASWAGTTISVPRLSPLATGGIVTRPTLALVGERGPEAVVPLSRLESMLGGGGVSVYVTNAVVGNNDELARVVVTALREAKTRGLLVGAGI